MLVVLIKRIIVALFLIAPFFLAVVAEDCHGLHKGEHLTNDKLQIILKPVPLVNLCGAILSHANLTKRDLSKINLSGADVSFASLQEVDLSSANLVLTYFKGANLARADLDSADLQKAVFEDSVLIGANLSRANMMQANLQDADLSGADLMFANLQGANLHSANLTGANLQWANLENADLSDATLENATLEGASLVSANLHQTNLTNANLTEADLKGAIYEPQLKSTPDLITFLSVKNLRLIHVEDINNSRASLTELRSAYKEVGIRSMEHQITAMIKYHEMQKGWRDGGWQWVESSVGFLLFYLTCDYGAAPIRPIEILLLSMLFFAVSYRAALSRANKTSGIICIWSPKRFVRWDKIKKINNNPKLFSRLLNNYFLANEINSLQKQCRLFGLAIFFSALSAFSIGWKEINVGNWISHLQSREYTLKGKGWVRAVAGFQSLFSAYLIVLWALCYFGRPFDW